MRTWKASAFGARPHLPNELTLVWRARYGQSRRVIPVGSIWQLMNLYKFSLLRERRLTDEREVHVGSCFRSGIVMSPQVKIKWKVNEKVNWPTKRSFSLSRSFFLWILLRDPNRHPPAPTGQSLVAYLRCFFLSFFFWDPSVPSDVLPWILWSKSGFLNWLGCRPAGLFLGKVEECVYLKV